MSSSGRAHDVVDARRLLRALGHDVSVASDGREGLEALHRLRPDVALVDIGLPVSDGKRVGGGVFGR